MVLYLAVYRAFCILPRSEYGPPSTSAEPDRRIEPPGMRALKSRRWPGLIPYCIFLVTVSCGPKQRSEKWIIPENYTGWLRLDYAIRGAPPLPLKDGAWIVQMPPSGRLETSSGYNDAFARNEYFVIT